MELVWPAFIGLLTMLLSTAGAALLARRYQQLGGGTAQLKLNSTLQQTMDAQGVELTSLRRQLDDAQRTLLEMAADFKACKTRLVKLERALADKAIGAADAG